MRVPWESSQPLALLKTLRDKEDSAAGCRVLELADMSFSHKTDAEKHGLVLT